MKNTGVIAAVAAALMLLTGCQASVSNEATATPIASASEPVYATENQVASVVSGYEADWREVIDSAGECRFEWTLSPDSIQAYTCYLSEQTATITAQLALRDFDALNVPPTMETLVSDTSTTLSAIGTVDLKATCGDGESPSNTDACNADIGKLYALYSALEDRLDSWAPYM